VMGTGYDNKREFIPLENVIWL